MSQGTINGKKPVSQRPKAAAINPNEDLFGNMLTIPPAIQTELAAKGLEARWVDSQKLYAMNGYHPKGWVPFKPEEAMKDSLGFKFGADPEGIVRRGTMILAVKRIEDADKHRAYLRHQAQLRDPKRVQRNHAESLKKFARSSETDLSVHQGYEDKEDSNNE